MYLSSDFSLPLLGLVQGIHLLHWAAKEVHRSTLYVLYCTILGCMYVLHGTERVDGMRVVVASPRILKGRR
jgi:hypothetical protein